MVVVPSGYEVGELANKHFFASLCARPNLARREIERGATPLTDRDNVEKGAVGKVDAAIFCFLPNFDDNCLIIF